MTPTFWDADGILFEDYLQKGQTINSTCNASLWTGSPLFENRSFFSNLNKSESYYPTSLKLEIDLSN